MIPADFIQNLLSKVDIAEVIGRHVQLKKAGANLTGLCPFHAEKSASFSVSPAKQFYHCFGCGASGDAIRFLTEYNALSFVDAVDELAGSVGLAVPQDDTSVDDRARAAQLKQRRVTLSDVLAKAAEAYRKALHRDPRARDYLKRRGLSDEIAAQFGLGFAPEGWRTLASVFPSYDDPLLVESGMVIAKDDEVSAGRSMPTAESAAVAPATTATTPTGAAATTSKRYDRFRDRIMFPIRSVQGDVIGFGGRVLGSGEPKYLNSPETPVFVKGRELYGLFEARNGLRQRGYALVVEGYMDVVALAQSGIGNAVATLGTACTAEHLQKLFRFTDAVVFSFDGDAAGRRAANRALEAALPLATDIRSLKFLFLPAEHDPDSYVRELGAGAFEERIAQAVPLSRQLIESAGDGLDLDTVEGRAHMLANARPLWNTLPPGALKRQLLVDLAAAGRDDLAALSRQWERSPVPGRDGAGSRTATSADGAFQAGAATPGRVFRPPGWRPGLVSRGTANLLDRALWLLIQRSELWATLDGASHDLLAAQTAPYDALFGGIERCIHEHGSMAPVALLTDLATQSGEAIDARSVLERVAAFHAADPGVDVDRDLALVLDGLRLRAVRDELDLMVEHGLISPDAHTRFKHLNLELARLKQRLASAHLNPM